MSAWSDRAFRAPGRSRFGGAVVVAFAVFAAPASAQSGPERLFDACVAAAPGAEGACADAALSVQALHGGIGLLATAGGAVPASPSTAGRRVAGTPRVVLDGGVGWASFRAPDLSGPVGPTGERDDQRMVLVGGRMTAAVGVFEGFSPIPTVGGVLALDAVGTAQFMRFPGSRGFSGSRLGWGAGVRLGVVRESFSLPGVTLSAMHYRTGTVRYGEPGVSGARASLEPRATSIRAIVGRDLLAVGIAGGVGWDRYEGDGRIAVDGSPPGVDAALAGPEDLRLTRRYLFAGANYTWLVAQLAGEVTWARTPFPRTELPGTGAFGPGARELQGAVTVRITY